MKKLSVPELKAYFKQEFIKRWTPSIDQNIVIAEIAIDTQYSFTYVKKLLQPLSEVKKAKQFVAGEILKLLDNINPSRLLTEYNLGYVYCKLDEMELNEIITDPILIVHIEKILSDEDL